MSDIIQEIRQGNKAAVKAVYQKYAKDVYNFANSITGDHDSALFATKKTFSILFNNIKNGEEPANLRTAALKIAYDEAYNAATAMKAADLSTDAYAESESPANKTYLKPKNIENRQRTYQNPSSNDDDYYDNQNNNYDAHPNTRTSNRRQYQEPEYDNYDDGYDDGYDNGYDDRYDNRYDNNDYDDDYDDEEYNKPRRKTKNNKRTKDVYNAFEDEDNDGYDDDYDDEDERPSKHRNKGLFVFCIIINVILILILLWFLCGLLVNLGVLPSIDIGYTWFNSHIYPLF